MLRLSDDVMLTEHWSVHYAKGQLMQQLCVQKPAYRQGRIHTSEKFLERSLQELALHHCSCCGGRSAF